MHITECPWNSTAKLVSSDSLAESGLVPLMHVKPKVWKETPPPTLHLHRAVDVIAHTCQLNPSDVTCVGTSHVTYNLIYLEIWQNVPKCKYFIYLFFVSCLYSLIYFYLFIYYSFILLFMYYFICFLFIHFTCFNYLFIYCTLYILFLLFSI